MSRRYSDSTLMGMTKVDLIEQLRIAEHNQKAAEDRLAQQAENLKSWEPVRHECWEEYSTSRFCGFDESRDPIYRDGSVYLCSNPRCRRKTVIKEKYCPSCGAKMDREKAYGCDGDQ